MFMSFFFALFIPLTLFAQVEIKTVSFSSTDGFLLKAKYYSAGKIGSGILLLHQCDRRGKLTGYETLAKVLSENGFHVLVPDSRGFGESRDEQYRDFHSQMNLIEPKVFQDAEAAFSFLIQQENVNRNKIGVAAASCGVRKAIRLASDHKEIKTMVFISGAFGLSGPFAQNFKQLDAVSILSLYSENDRYGTPAAMRYSFENSKSERSKLLAYKGDKHGTPLLSQDKNLVPEISIWFSTFLN